LSSYGKIDKEKLDLLVQKDKENKEIIDSLKHRNDLINAQIDDLKRQLNESELRHKEEMKVLDEVKTICRSAFL